MVQHQLSRVRGIAASVEELISILLVLAKSADRLERSSELISLTELVHSSAHDHSYLCDERALVIELIGSAQLVILAPAAVVSVVVGNLIRNAIENSDKGTIRIEVSENAQVTIDDPGHGMTPEEISALYARMVKGEARDGQGIGLELIARLCGHLDWPLSFEYKPDGKGTRATVDMSSSLRSE